MLAGKADVSEQALLGRRISVHTIEMQTEELTGHCLCGATAYRLTAEPFSFQYCHCSRCRRRSGSAHAANLFAPPESLVWTAGGDEVGTYTLEGDPPFPTGFCRTCGSAMPSMSTTGKFWVMPAGSFNGDPGLRPKHSIFWANRAPWFECVSDLERHEEWPPS